MAEHKSVASVTNQPKADDEIHRGPCGPGGPCSSKFFDCDPSELPSIPAGKPLAVEWEFYKRHAAEWVAQGLEGKFVLIKGEELIDVFDDWLTTLRAGSQRFGLVPFMAKQIWLTEPVLRGIRGVDRPPFTRLDRSEWPV